MEKFFRLGLNILFFIIFNSFFGCSRGKPSAKDFEHVVVDHNIIHTIHSSKFLQSYEYIALETLPNAIIGNVDKLKVFDGKLFVLSENQVFVYDFSGNFLFKIDESGRGPGEYLKINNISLDSNILYIYDNVQYRILLFSAEDGQYLNTHTTLHSVKEMQFVDNYFFADRSMISNKYIEGNERLLVGKIEEQEPITSSFFPMPTSEAINNYRLESYDKQVFWINPLYNRIYKLERDTLMPYIAYDFGSLNVSSDLPSGVGLTELGEEGKVFNLSNTYQNKKYMVSNIDYANQSSLMVYDMNTGANTIYRHINNHLYHSVPLVHAVYQDRFYKVVPAWEVIFMKENMKEKDYQLTDKMEGFDSYKIVNSRSESDNPLIAVFKLK